MYCIHLKNKLVFLNKWLNYFNKSNKQVFFYLSKSAFKSLSFCLNKFLIYSTVSHTVWRYFLSKVVCPSLEDFINKETVLLHRIILRYWLDVLPFFPLQIGTNLHNLIHPCITNVTHPGHARTSKQILWVPHSSSFSEIIYDDMTNKVDSFLLEYIQKWICLLRPHDHTTV